MPRGCRPVCRSGRVSDGIDSTTQTSVQRPTATAQDRCRARCGARPAGQNVTRPQAAPDGRRVRAAATEQTDRTARGRPRSPCRGGIASTSAKTPCESFRLAPVRRAASGTPCPSQIRCRLLPRLARSVGFGPVSVPPHTARTEQLSTASPAQIRAGSRCARRHED
jgi:hypothetical protein